MRFGEETGPVAMPTYGAYRFTRVAGPTPDAPDVYSPIQAGWVSPGHSQNTPLPVWSPAGKGHRGAPTPRPRPMASRSALNLRRKSVPSGAGSRIRDPIGRSDVSRTGRRHRLVRPERKPRARLGVQSPFEAAEVIAYLLGEARAPFKPARINAQFTYVGGGFGGRDHTPFVLYVALAAIFFPVVRSGWRMTAISSFRPASSATPSRYDRRSGSIGDRQDSRIRRRPHSRWRRPRQFLGQCGDRWRAAAIGIYDFRKST